MVNSDGSDGGECPKLRKEVSLTDLLSFKNWTLLLCKQIQELFLLKWPIHTKKLQRVRKICVVKRFIWKEHYNRCKSLWFWFQKCLKKCLDQTFLLFLFWDENSAQLSWTQVGSHKIVGHNAHHPHTKNHHLSIAWSQKCS